MSESDKPAGCGNGDHVGQFNRDLLGSLANFVDSAARRYYLPRRD
jgi:hypothetical protein